MKNAHSHCQDFYVAIMWVLTLKNIVDFGDDYHDVGPQQTDFYLICMYNVLGPFNSTWQIRDQEIEHIFFILLWHIM